MPIYGYVCEQCEHSFEVMHGVKDPQPVQCEQCGGSLRRRIFPVGVIFKGDGFYHTEYGKGKDFKKLEAKESEGGSSSKKETESKDKPAKKESKDTE